MSNGWNYNQQLCMMIPVWFDGPQFPPSIIRKKIIQRRRYQSMVANPENTEEILLSAPKKGGKLKQLN